MEQLSAADQKLLSDSLVKLYAYADSEAFPRIGMDVVKELIPSDLTVYTELWLNEQRVIDLADPIDAHHQALLPLFVQFQHQHPLVNNVIQQDDPTARTICDVLPRPQWERTELYQEVFRPLRVRDQLGSVVWTRPGTAAGFACNRTTLPFTERDRTLLNLLGPHIIQAHRNAESVSHLKLEAGRAAMDEIGPALLALTMDGQVRSTTSRGHAQLRSYFPRWREGAGTLPEAVQRWIALQRSADGNLERFRAPREPLVIRGRQGTLVVRLMEDRCDKGWLLVIEERPDPPEPTHSDDQPHLAPRLRAVLRCLLQGDSEKEAAIRLDLSRHTVHQYVKMIYRKYDVSSRGELMARFLIGQ